MKTVNVPLILDIDRIMAELCDRAAEILAARKAEFAKQMERNAKAIELQNQVRIENLKSQYNSKYIEVDKYGRLICRRCGDQAKSCGCYE
jgi:hypothetical protein